jgi:hypothetical protein
MTDGKTKQHWVYKIKLEIKQVAGGGTGAVHWQHSNNEGCRRKRNKRRCGWVIFPPVNVTGSS